MVRKLDKDLCCMFLFAILGVDPALQKAFAKYKRWLRVLIAEISVPSPIVINMQTRELLAGETKSSFV